jgi:hypothetical protein
MLLRKLIFALFSAFIVIFPACLAPEEGCLDVQATNFNFEARRACDTCCTYPSLVLEVAHLADTNAFSFARTYKIGSDSVQILEAVFYFSDFSILKPSGETSGVRDSFRIVRAQDSIFRANDVALVSKSLNFTYTLGKFKSVGVVSKLNFLLGLNAETQKTIPSKMPSNSVMSIGRDSMYNSLESKYLSAKFTLRKPNLITGKNDTFRFKILKTQAISLTKEFVLKEGFNAVLPISINYLRFFEGVNYALPQNQIEEKIVVNFSNAFK